MSHSERHLRVALLCSFLARIEHCREKYAFMEENLGNVAGARQIYERWMKWEPDFNAWMAYIKLEVRYVRLVARCARRCRCCDACTSCAHHLHSPCPHCAVRRHKNIERARSIFERFRKSHAEVRTYVKWARFETKHGNREGARQVYARALEELGEDANSEELFINFAKFEENAREWERARVIYKYALDHIPKHRAEQLYQTYTAFEKQHGDRCVAHATSLLLAVQRC